MAMWSNSKAQKRRGVSTTQGIGCGNCGFESLSISRACSLVMENEENVIEDKVNLMTLHRAKGLEFSTVFCQVGKRSFPHQRALEIWSSGLEEERRLAYVGQLAPKNGQLFLSQRIVEFVEIGKVRFHRVYK